MTSDTILDGKKLLLVDDEPDVLDTLADLLAQCRIQTATSFSEAETLLENEDFDLAVLDIMGVAGYELLKIATRRKIPTVMLTAHAIGPEHVVKSHDEGAASYLPKEEMINIESVLADLLEDRAQNRNPWQRWVDRFASYFDKKFGPDWQEKHGFKVR